MTDDPIIPEVSSKPLVNGWQFLVIVLLIVVGAVISFRGLQQGNENSARQSTVAATLRQAEIGSERRDCVTTLSTARRSVFDNVDIYKAILIQAAADRSLFGTVPEALDFYRDVDTKLSAALKEARRLQPPKTLDDLIAHGGMVDGRRYDACPG